MLQLLVAVVGFNCWLQLLKTKKGREYGWRVLVGEVGDGGQQQAVGGFDAVQVVLAGVAACCHQPAG